MQRTSARQAKIGSPQPYVFIAHKSDDKGRIRPIVASLLERGFTIWIDNPEEFKPRLASPKLQRLRASQDYQLAIPKCIDEAGCVLVIWSSKSIDSPDVRAEATQALRQNKLVPVRIDQVEPPYVFAELKTPDLTAALEARNNRLSQDAVFDAVADDIRQTMSLPQVPPRFAWEQYQGLFRPADYQIAFAPFLNPGGQLSTTFKMGSVSINRDTSRYTLPDAFKSTRIDQPNQDLMSCRLIQWLKAGPGELELTLSPVQYSDYLKSGEHLDAPFPDDHARTYREHFAKIIPGPEVSLRKFPLTNICGVGLFIISRDDQVLITRHSPSSHVYPLRWTFSASGTMRWGAVPNPFTEVLWKCRQETDHQADLSRLELVELGADARKLFFEFCFLEHSEASSAELAKSLPRKLECEMLPLSPVSDFVESVVTECWEPAAEATLLGLAIRRHGAERTLRALSEHKDKWRHRQMRDEWDLRASRPGSLAVMSVRYPARELEEASADYVDSVIKFMRADVRGKRVLEVGSGIGRITRLLAQVCRHVTCVEMCELMNRRNKESLGAESRKVQLRTGFVQDFKPAKMFDAAVCSLTLVHNVDQRDFEAAVEVMCRSARTVFVFEDITQGRRTSPHTRLLSEAKLRGVFGKFGFAVKRATRRRLFKDTIIFLKFESSAPPARRESRRRSH
jgi:2-polyprenyl-3-methyl-5-hydroxy-6-metoxy-1,4-benzoquinol methylase